MLTIDDILEEIIDKYTLSNSRFKELKTAYDSIADWIADGDDFCITIHTSKIIED